MLGSEICLEKNIAFQCGIHAKLLSSNIRRIRNICQIVGIVIMEKSRGEVSLMEQDTIENVS